MDKTNQIERAIEELDGGQFQTFVNQYLYKAYIPKRMVEYGSQSGTNKVRKGDPDTYIDWGDGTYSLIMLTTVKNDLYKKLHKDILDCLNKKNINISRKKIREIICVYASSRISIEESEKLKTLVPKTKVVLIDLNIMARDLNNKYPKLAYDFFQIPVDTGQILDRENFIERFDAIKMNAPLNLEFLHRSSELADLRKKVLNSEFTLITGPAGVGKTRLALEACRYYESKGYIIYCIKNNGESLVGDVEGAFSQNEKYILFIDDINGTKSLKYILEFIKNLSSNIRINLVATVRDYAAKKVAATIEDYFEVDYLILKNFKKNEIDDLLKKDFNIRNGYYLRKISSIAKGNARLAVLAAISAIENGYEAINSAVDIFRNYYIQIFEKRTTSFKMIATLFIISFYGKLSMESERKETIASLLSFFEMSRTEFISNCKLLSGKELVDVIEDEIVRMSNPNLGDYILEYVLIEKKYITIKKLLDLTFSKSIERDLYTINTLNSIFATQKMKEYIEKEILNSWDNAPAVLWKQYLSSFYALDETKSLAFVNEYIDGLESEYFDVSQKDFVTNQISPRVGLNLGDMMNNGKVNRIEQKDQQLVFNILGGFKNLNDSEKAIELIIKLFNKRSDWAHDIYQLFVDHYCFDQFSQEYDFNNEIQLVKIFWDNIMKKWDKNLTSMMIQVFRKLLYCQISCISLMDTAYTVQSIQYNLSLTPQIKRIRSLIWNGLLHVYSNDDTFSPVIENMIVEYYGSGLTRKEFEKIYLFDLKYIKELVENWKEYSFSRCNIMFEIADHMKYLNIDNSYFVENYNSNKEFNLYLNFSGRIESFKHDKRREIRKQDIKRIIVKYTRRDFRRLFEFCNEWKEYSFVIESQLSSGIEAVFELTQGKTIFKEALSEYLFSGMPCDDPFLIVSILTMCLESNSFDDVMNMFEGSIESKKIFWMGELWGVLPEEKLSSKRTKEFIRFFEVSLESDTPFIPDVKNLNKFKKFNKNIVSIVGNLLLNSDNLHKEWVSAFLSYRNNLTGYFENNIKMLEKLYLICPGSDSFKLNLGIDILKVDSEFWPMLVEKLKTISFFGIDSTPLLKLWMFNSYDKYVDYLLNESNNYSSNNDLIEKLFEQSTDQKIIDRQTQWVKNFISQNYSDKTLMYRLFTIICNKLGDKEIEFYHCLFSCSTDKELIMGLPIFSRSFSFSGSELPLIDRKINFLKKFISSIDNIDLLNFEEGLQESKRNLEKYREKVRIDEALDLEYY